VTDDLDTWWAELQPLLSARFFAVFPGLPTSVRNRPDALSVAWPVGRSVEEFLDLASALGVRMIYASAQLFGEEESERLRLMVPATIPGDDDFVRAAELLWSGRVVRVALVWMLDGVAHYWGQEADWYSSLWQEAESIRQGGQPVVYALAGGRIDQAGWPACRLRRVHRPGAWLGEFARGASIVPEAQHPQAAGTRGSPVAA
jgi:hypothetical protein